jgi:hypothetical protein
MRPGLFRILLGARVARVAAACLLVLIALPFTAPFSTCDLRDHSVLAGLADGDEWLTDKITEDASFAVTMAVPPVIADVPSHSDCTVGCAATAVVDRLSTSLQLRL